MIRETCVCGHDVDTHFREVDAAKRVHRGACLGARCDCPAYRYDDPEGPKTERMRHGRG